MDWTDQAVPIVGSYVKKNCKKVYFGDETMAVRTLGWTKPTLDHRTYHNYQSKEQD